MRIFNKVVLPEPLRAHDRHEFAFPRLQTNVRERLLAIGISEPQAADLKHWGTVDGAHSGHLSARKQATAIRATPPHPSAACGRVKGGKAGSGKAPW